MNNKVILDPAFRRMDEIFHPDHLARLHASCDVVWGKDDPMPPELIERECPAPSPSSPRNGATAT